MSELPDSWLTIKLSEDVTYKKGKKPKVLLLENNNNNELDPYIDIKAFEKGIIRKYAQPEDGIKALSDDTLMVWDGARSGLVGNGIEGIIGSTLMKINPVSSNKKYFHFFLESQYGNINSRTKGMGIPHVDPAVLWNIPYSLPPLNEQIRIANKLDSLLGKLEATQKRLDKIPTLLKRFRQSVLAAAVSGELTAEWRKSNKLSKASSEKIQEAWKAKYKADKKKYKPLITENVEKELINLPKTWEASNIGSVFDVYVGSTPKRKNKEYWGGSIPWVSSSEVAFNTIRNTKETITKKGLINTSTKVHPSGTVMLAMIGQGKTRGQPAILKIKACHNQNTAAIRVCNEYCLSEFLFYFLWGKYEDTRRVGAGNNQKALNKTTVQSLSFPLPPLKEQKQIVKRVETLFKLADKVEQQYQAAKQRTDKLTQSILAKAFRGELVPQDPNDEPASELLARILTTHL